MPTASTAKKVTTPRKRRTRKASTPKTTDKVIKEIQAVLDAPRPKSLDKVSTTAVKSATLNTPVVKKTVTKEQPVKSNRPAQPNLTWKDYRADAIVRWNIHSYEVNELGKDFGRGYELVKQHLAQVVTYTKESYNKAFN